MLEGLPPNNAAHVMRLTCDEKMARAVSDLIVETFDTAETAAAAFEIAASTQHWGPVPWAVEVYFGHAPDEAQVRALVAVVAGEAAAETAVFGRVAQKDWVATALEGLNAVRAGRFVVHGSHGRGQVKSNDVALEIEAALAFGTGHHGTTRGCLLLLDSLLKRRRPRHVLDIGTGTGVLAIAAARVLKRRIAAGDIDPVSVVAARQNAWLNQAGAHVRPVVARGLGHPALAGQKYDLVLANILARPLRLMAPAVAAACAFGGEAILSGLLVRDVAGVLSSYAAQGLFLKRRLELEGWASLLLARSRGLAG